MAENLQLELTKARQEISNLRQKLNALQHIHRKDIEKVTNSLQNWQCTNCRKQEESAQCSNSSPSNYNTEDFCFKPIGVITSEFPRIRGTPRQPTITMNHTRATLTLNKNLFTNPSHALQDLDQFSHIWIIFAFHENASHPKAKVAPPRLNGARTGVFATRSPHRPCPIGLSLVKVENIVGNIIYFTGVDMIDNTPVFDIKPYIPQYDRPDVLMTLNQMDTTDDVGDVEISSTPVSQQPISNVSYLPREILGNSVELLATDPGGLDINTTDQEQTGILREISVPPDGHPNTNLSNFERGDPDGEEEETESNSGQNNAPDEEVRVPSWIVQSPVNKLTVLFTETSLAQLRELGPELVEERKTIISNVLHEDPRSVYLREVRRCTYYIWRIVNLCVACKFNDNEHTVQITKIFRNDCG